MHLDPHTDTKCYYARRAREYESIFAKPERLPDLQSLRALLQDLFAGREVLEIASGTGHWTQIISESAKSILATDINEEVVEIARQKNYPKSNVTFRIADACTLANVTGSFSAGFAGFWWSHVPRAGLREFLATFHAKLQPGALVVFLDNNYVEGNSTPITRCDADGNTYQIRRLENGMEFEVLKNYPTEDELRNLVASQADVNIAQFKYYWVLRYTTV